MEAWIGLFWLISTDVGANSGHLVIRPAFPGPNRLEGVFPAGRIGYENIRWSGLSPDARNMRKISNQIVYGSRSGSGKEKGMKRSVMSVVAGAVMLSGAAMASAEMVLTITGDCNSEVTGTVTGVTPGADVAILYSHRLGEFVIPDGYMCAGTVLDLARPILWDIEEAEEDGILFEDEDLHGRGCGVYIQVVDLETCEVSNVAQIPG